MKFIKPLLAALLLLTFIACKNHAAKEKVSTDISLADVKMEAPLAADQEKQQSFKPADQAVGNYEKSPENQKQHGGAKLPTPALVMDLDKKIIKTANLTIEVKDYQKYYEFIRIGVKQFGGYVATEEQNESDYKIENTIVVKVPVDKFDETVNKFLTDKEKIIVKKISSDDVTSEVVDIKSRIEAKKQVRQRYLDLLKLARNMEEILQVQNEINNIQVDIESATARVQYLTQSSAYSTIHLSFYQVLNPDANNTHHPSYGFRIVASFKNGLQWIGELVIALIALWPAWVVIAFGWMMIRKYRPFAAKKSQ
jgi:flagellar biosynthesis chaperone FliJ